MVQVQAAVLARAWLDGGPVTVEHVCRACVQMVAVDGVRLSLASPLTVSEPVTVTGRTGARLAELQVTVGEGPGITALEEGRPVLVPDLDAETAVRRWPLFVPAAVEAGVGALFAFPLQVGAITMGVLELCRARPGGLTGRQFQDALLFAEVVRERVLNGEVSDEVTDQTTGGSGDCAGFLARWPEVHQASGMISVQLGVGLAEAFVRLRAHAFAQDRGLRLVARDVVDRVLRFTPEELIGGP
ncbi:MAG: GAF and ANTAR domain-containing protein [Streptosporangiaceae bacterium]